MRLAFGILLLAACSNEPASRSAALISDAVHSGGTPGFYFLPPLVAAPALEGSFDASQSPTVDIEERDPKTLGLRRTLVSYTMTSGLRVDAAGQAYSVNWRTDQFTLDERLLYRISVSLDKRVIGFADVDVVLSQAQVKKVDTGEFIPLVDGKNLVVKFWLGGCAHVVCAASDSCHEAGVCQPATGECTRPRKPDNSSCSDGNGCTIGDRCFFGVCSGQAVHCIALDSCHEAGTCDPATGQCSQPVSDDGAACDDNDGCTVGDHCEAGICSSVPRVCKLAHASSACEAGNCSVLSCAQQYVNCNGDPTDGCEVHVSDDHDNCGGCGLACAPGEVCLSNSCHDAQCTAPVADAACDDGNPCTQIDLCEGGRCVGVVPVSHATTFPVGNTCVYLCDLSWGDCNGVARDFCETDLKQNVLNCGACGHACPNDQICVQGQCAAKECSLGDFDHDLDPRTGVERLHPPSTICVYENGPFCIDLWVNDHNCGQCGHVCITSPTTVYGQPEICDQGQCSCDYGGRVKCPGTDCVLLEADPNNCGSCGHVCRAGQICRNGGCCTQCGSQNECVNLQTDPLNCGTCGHSCGDSDHACVNGQCGCAFGVECSGVCTILENNHDNCGACNKRCAANQICMGHSCFNPTCAPCAGSSCTNLTADPNNCGGCGQVCGSGTVCFNSHCVGCDGLLACNNSCVFPDDANCGSCGKVCSSPTHCVNSQCQ